HVFERFLDSFGRRQRAPTLGVRGPGVTGEQDATPALATVVWVIQVSNRKVGDCSTAKNTIVFFPEAPLALKENLCRRVVIELTDGALLLPREWLQELDVA